MSARLTSVALAVVLAFTLVHYVRRTIPRRTAAAVVVTDQDGSRDRRLHGKARVRARRGR